MKLKSFSTSKNIIAFCLALTVFFDVSSTSFKSEFTATGSGNKRIQNKLEQSEQDFEHDYNGVSLKTHETFSLQKNIETVRKFFEALFH